MENEGLYLNLLGRRGAVWPWHASMDIINQVPLALLPREDEEEMGERGTMEY